MQNDSWIEANDAASGKDYFYNTVTRIGSWRLPAGVKAVEAPAGVTPTLPIPFDTDAHVWVADEEEVCSAATVAGDAFCAGEAGVVRFDDGHEMSMEPSETAALLPMNPQVLDPAIDDLITLDELNEFSLLHKLRLRFARDEIYTNVSSVLISMNPFKRMEALMAKDQLDLYMHQSSTRKLPPHIYAIGHNAYAGMMSSKNSQSILVSGESGAGKTEATKLILKFLAEASKLAGQGEGGGSESTNLEGQILQASPILEAFGNAKTTRNNNSSRFGKLVSVQFDPLGKLQGANITNYLLEKSRLVQHGEGERNYHIFYQLLVALDDMPAVKEATSLALPTDEACQYTILNSTNEDGSLEKGKPGIIPMDKSNMEEMRESMTALHIDDGMQTDIYTLLASMLHIGNVAYTQETAADGSQTTSVAGGVGGGFGIAASLLGVGTEPLQKSLCSRHVTSTGLDVYVPYTVEEAKDNTDALVKKVYANLFDWLVSRINTTLAANMGGGGDVEGGLFIRVLDIFGFEIFKKNSFEQLCINYCNEQLHFFFNNHIFKMEQAEYERQGIPVPTIEYEDNAACLALIDDKGGIFSMVDEENRIPKGSDHGFLSKVLNKFGAGGTKDKHMAKTSVKRKDARECFSVVHFAGTVDYNVEGFLEKNRDFLHEDIEKVLAASAHTLLKLLMGTGGDFAKRSSITAAGGGKASGKKAKAGQTLSAKFKRQMQLLMASLKVTEPHFVRCIKPNDLQKPAVLEAAKVQFQLRCNGLLEVCKIRQVGYPVRLPFTDFVSRFKHLVQEKDLNDVDALCAELSLIGALQNDQWAKGKDKIFLRVSSVWRLDNWEEICAQAIKMLHHFSRLARAVGTLRFRTKLLAALTSAYTAHDLEATEAKIAEGTAALPHGGGHTAQMKKANEMLPQLRIEHACKLKLKEACAARAMDALQAAVSEAEGLNEPTLNASAEIDAARRMIVLLQREDALRAGLGSALASFDYPQLRELLAEATHLGLAGPELEGAVALEAQVTKLTGELQAEVESEVKRVDMLGSLLGQGEAVKMALAGDEAAAVFSNAQILLMKIQKVQLALGQTLESPRLTEVQKLVAQAKELGMDDVPEMEHASAYLGEVEKVKESLDAAISSGEIDQIEAVLATASAKGMEGSKEYEKAKEIMHRINKLKQDLRDATSTRNKVRLAKLVLAAKKLGLNDAPDLREAEGVLCLMDVKGLASIIIEFSNLLLLGRDHGAPPPLGMGETDVDMDEKMASLSETLQRAAELGLTSAEHSEVATAERAQEMVRLQTSLRETMSLIEAARSGLMDAGGDDGGDGVSLPADVKADPAGKLMQMIVAAEKVHLVGNPNEVKKDDDTNPWYLCEEVQKAAELHFTIANETNFLGELRDAVKGEKMAALARQLLVAAKMPSLSDNAEVQQAKEVYTTLMDKYEQESSGPLLAGWMHKLGEKRRNYKKRWFELANGELSYYTAQNKASLKGSISLSLVLKVAPADEDEKHGKFHAFKMITPKRVWNFRCAEQADYDKWYEELRNATLAALLKKEREEAHGPNWGKYKRDVNKRTANVAQPEESKVVKVETLEDISNRPLTAELKEGAKRLASGAAADSGGINIRIKGQLFTGTLWVKQDLQAFENLYKPIDWKPYYFVLEDKTLYCFQDGLCRNLIGAVMITKDSTVYPTSLSPYSFQVVTPYLVMHLDSTKKEETNAWIRALQDLIHASTVGHLPAEIVRAAKKACVGSEMYSVTYGADGTRTPLKLKLKPKTKRWALVTQAAKGSEITVGSVLSKVNDRSVHEEGYHHIVNLLRQWQPPLTLTFRRAPTAYGFMRQQTPNTHKWKLRYLSVECGALQVYSTKDGGEELETLKGFMDLEGACVRVIPSNEKIVSGKDNCFMLVGGTGKLIFNAKDVAELHRWTSVLIYACSCSNGGEVVLDAMAEAEEEAANGEGGDMSLVASAMDNTVEFNGWLNKYSTAIRNRRRMRNWKKRYFCLSAEGGNPRLAYYTSKDQHLQKGTINITSAMSVEIIYSTTETQGKECCFKIGDATTELVMQAEDEANREQWVAAIQSAIHNLQKKNQPTAGGRKMDFYGKPKGKAGAHAGAHGAHAKKERSASQAAAPTQDAEA
jgi:myosin heavy subunit